MSVAKRSFAFSLGTMFSRLTGLLRESVIGAVFGASYIVDAFNVAYRIPNLLRELLAEGALGSSFQKVYKEICLTDRERAFQLYRSIFLKVSFGGLILSFLGFCFSAELVGIMTPTHANPQMIALATKLTQILFPFLIFMALGALVQGVLYEKGKFFLVGLAPIAFNVFSIVGALSLVIWNATKHFHDSSVEYETYFSIYGLAVGTLLGGLGQLVLMMLFGRVMPIGSQEIAVPNQHLASSDKSPRTVVDDTRKVVKLMLPMLVAGAAGQVNVIVNTNFATGLQEGSVSWLSYAFRLFQLPVGVLAVGIGTASLDALTKAFTGRVGTTPNRDSDPVNSSFQGSLEHTFWMLAPAFIFLYLGSTNLVSLVFEAGKFSSNDKIMTAAALQAYALGLIGYGLLKLMNSYFYAAGQTKWPMWIGIGSVALNYVLNALFVEQYRHVGLAMTASLVLTLNSALLMLLAYRQGLRIRWTPIVRILGWMLLAGGAALVVSEVLSNEVIGNIFGISQLAPSTLGNKIISALSLSVIGFMIVVVVVFASGAHSKIIASFKAKFR